VFGAVVVVDASFSVSDEDEEYRQEEEEEGGDDKLPPKDKGELDEEAPKASRKTRRRSRVVEDEELQENVEESDPASKRKRVGGKRAGAKGSSLPVGLHCRVVRACFRVRCFRIQGQGGASLLCCFGGSN
jgi:hypothetical protein